MKKFIKSFGFARKGLKIISKEERYFKIGIVIGILVIITSFILRFSYLEIAVLILAVTIVVGAEIVNTAVEDLCDKVEPNHDIVIRKIKDIISAFVLVSGIGATMVGIIIFAKHLQYFFIF